VAYILQGEIAVEVENGITNRFKKSGMFTEVKDLRHCGFNTGTTPVKILMYVIGTQGMPVPKPASKSGG
jgi:hypothetical protein